MMQAQNGAATSTAGSTSQASNPINQAFASLDTNGDGTISQSEMENAIENAGGTAAEADQVYTALGGTSSAGISQSAFQSAAQSGMSSLNQMAGLQGADHHHHHHHGGGTSASQDADQIFAAMDTNGDGSISPDELSTALGSTTAGSGTATSSNANSLFASIDTNGDGSISQSELSNYLNTLQTQMQNDQSTLSSFRHLANRPTIRHKRKRTAPRSSPRNSFLPVERRRG